MEILLPHNFEPRDYQLPLWNALDSGKYQHACIVWHRRAGKDVNCWNYAVRETNNNRQTTKYAFPTAEMAKDNLWDAYTNDGMRFTDFVPMPIRFRRNAGDDGLNDTFKEIRFKLGGSLRVISTHKPDSLRGGNSKLFVLSEFQRMDPRVIDIIEPIVEANGGHLLVNLTPAGNNHAKGSFESWQNDPRWFTQVLTANDTPVFALEQLVRIKQSIIERYQARGLSEEEAVAFFEQEYMCSFESPVVGSYFGSAMRRAELDGRIANVPHEPQLKVMTFWDLGVDDSTSIWFVQVIGREIRLIDYFEASGEGLPFYAKVLAGQHEGFERMKNYVYSTHYGPHDIEVRELSTGVSRKTTAESLGISFTPTPAPKTKEEGIEAIRTILARCWFDKTKCKRGIDALKGYRKDWNDELQVYKNKPIHDWTSHGTDAFQTMALNNPQPMVRNEQPKQHQTTRFNVT